MKLAPVLLFTFKRLEQTRQTIDALRQNFLAPESELFIFSDGPRNEKDSVQVLSVREYLQSVTGFKKVTIFESAENKGLANSIIGGVSRLIDQYEEVIVLEDDLLTSRNFLSFCNQALHHYRLAPGVFSVGAYTRPVKGLRNDQVYFAGRASSWGWATWKEKWNKVDWDVKDYNQFAKDKTARRQFNQMGSDMAGMLDKQMSGQINSWAIRWCYHQFKNKLTTVFPATSKVENIGFNDAAATHTRDRFNRFKTRLDTTDNTVFDFSDDLNFDRKIIRQFVKPYTIPERIKYKLLNSLPGF